jgi:hypothetical protein
MDLLTLTDELASYVVWLEARITELESALGNQEAWSEIGDSKHRSKESFDRLMQDRREFAEEWNRRRNQRKGWAD